MVKVFLVEDEAIIRHGIRDNIDWASHGFEFAGEAGDGEYAYPLILKAQPDILVTDGRAGAEPSGEKGASAHADHRAQRLQ